MDLSERDELYRQGFKLLKENQPDLAIQQFKKRDAKYELFEIAEISPEYFIPNIPFVAQFHDVKLFNEIWILLDKNKIYNKELAGRNLYSTSIIKHRMSEDKKFVIINLEKVDTTIKIPQACVFLGGDENYSHWLLRYLMRLMLIEDHAWIRELPLLVNSELYPYQLESLKLLGIAEEQLIKVPPRAMVECENIIIPLNLRRSDLMNEHGVLQFNEGIKWIRKKILQNPKKLGTKRIYVSREDTKRRRMTNESQVLELLSKYGFEKVVPGRMSFSEQVETFSQASIVVGAHGAGLTNVLFCPLNAIAIELSDVIVSYMKDFKGIASGIPIRYYEFISTNVQTYQGEQPHDNHDFDVDIQKLQQLLTQIGDM